jgi:hypothetical protein
MRISQHDNKIAEHQKGLSPGGQITFGDQPCRAISQKSNHVHRSTKLLHGQMRMYLAHGTQRLFLICLFHIISSAFFLKRGKRFAIFINREEVLEIKNCHGRHQRETK